MLRMYAIIPQLLRSGLDYRPHACTLRLEFREPEQLAKPT
jgi:hypothetical protein